jgi:pyruvate,water dikinase
MKVLWLDDPECRDPARVGGKAATLARLTADYPVPPGFCLTTAALAGLSGEESLPSVLRDALASAYQELGERCGTGSPAVAVRSSGVGEDSATASFAGQYESVPNVVGVPALVEAVERCLRSAHSARLRAYQPEAATGGRLAVLVQQMVAADVAAVAFSANPVSGDVDEIVVNATWGLGESLVGGRVTPDAWSVRKCDLAVLSQEVSEKAWMSVAALSGVRVVATPVERRQAPALTEAQVREIAGLARALEAREGGPVDIECAREGDRLFLLQCRPITAFGPGGGGAATPVEWLSPEDAGQTWRWSKMAFPEPLTPLVQSYLPYHTQGWVRDSRAQGTAGEIRVRFERGYAYFLWTMTGLTTWEEVARRAAESERALLARWWWEFLPLLRADHARARSRDLAALADGELSQALHEMLAAQVRHFIIHAHVATVSYGAVERLVNWYLSRFPDAPEPEPYRLLQGEPTLSLESAHRLWKLGRMLPSEAVPLLAAGAWDRLPEPFRQAWEAYLAEFGHRTHRLADPGSPTWQEDPTPVARLVLSTRENDSRDPKVERERLAAERDAFAASVRDRLSAEERGVFESLLDTARANYPITEDHNHWIDQQSPADLRLLCAEFARRMTARGALDATEDLSYLTLEEIALWGFGRADPLRPRVARRRAEHAANRRITPPETLGAPPEPSPWVDRFGGPAEPIAAGKGEIGGVAASAGVARGSVRVVRTLAEAAELQKGEILVCVTTDPTWTPLFGVAAALVTDVGGSLCHAAVVAREYRLPAVVGTHTATRTLRTGQWVEVDGGRGIVRLIGS